MSQPSFRGIIANINRDQLIGPTDSPSNDAPYITNCRTLASYNWLDRVKPTMLVPGSPPAWTPLKKSITLSEDSGTYFRDKNAARFASYPLQPAMEAIIKQDPGFDLDSVDLVACGSTLGNLLCFVRGLDVKFRILVEAVGSTVFFLRRDGSPTDVIPGVRGFGHTFPESYTSWDRAVKGSESHQRIVQYRFGDVECVVRFEADGYLPDRCDEQTSAPDTSANDHSALPSLLQQTTVSSHEPEDTTSLTILDGGHSIPQAAIFDLKTRSFKRKDDDILAEIVPRLWVSQIPNSVLAFHRYGKFHDIRIQDTRPAIQAWEQKESETLRQFHGLLGQLIGFVHGQPDGRFEIVREERGDSLELREVTPRVNHVIPDELKEQLFARFYDAVEDTGDLSDRYAEDEDGSPSCDSESEKDFTACSASSCGYCGRCGY
ncbi:hypothetical protein P170DRAFT_357450 [Aspergillus steynii IBT 23096]|uniref:Geranylgeranyl pyrophosphate synthetase n=1 Tax=Aspergillus steynii IBT 23096 TaxID=1392250 RepID=A0A2I2G709_9EURO|nr:uncharacterized protein P170DRAFT_357450 [Aspergillus steynii IBT 23096]PLB48658.1 hypothetical protein P170DRAFT_357450 [Aspergillus steynii IBT 23096]